MLLLLLLLAAIIMSYHIERFYEATNGVTGASLRCVPLTQRVVTQVPGVVTQMPIGIGGNTVTPSEYMYK